MNPTPVHQDALPGWREGKAKRAILDFVRRVTQEGGSGFVPVKDRIAVFDNDGTLWCEYPMPVQLYFAADDARRQATSDPAMAGREPYRSLLANDLKAVGAQGKAAVLEIIRTTHSGMTTDEYDANVRDWAKAALHPKLNRPIRMVVYQPMLELLDYLRNNGFTPFIVSGGGADFMRVYAEELYGIPSYQVIGTTIKTHFALRDGKPILVIDPALDFYDDKAVKPVAIRHFIGRRPIACFGNSDGDREMMQWTTLGRTDGYPSLGLLVHHTDAEREFKYDREPVLSGRLDQGLDEADRHGWVLADMKNDWTTVFPEN